MAGGRETPTLATRDHPSAQACLACVQILERAQRVASRAAVDRKALISHDTLDRAEFCNVMSIGAGAIDHLVQCLEVLVTLILAARRRWRRRRSHRAY
jgi:hypothetical protein